MREHIYQLLFVGGQNVGFSAAAAAFANAKGRKDVVAHYAGLSSGAVAPLAWRVLSGFQLAPSPQEALVIGKLKGLIPDVAVSLCPEVESSCAVLPGNPVQLHWRLDDPVSEKSDADWQMKMLRERFVTIKRLVDDLFDRGYLDAFLQSRRTSEMVLDHISEGVIAHDLQRRIFYFNAAAERITGYKRESVLNRDCHTVIPGGLCGAKCSL